jgi:hypothetical protein
MKKLIKDYGGHEMGTCKASRQPGKVYASPRLADT